MNPITETQLARAQRVWSMPANATEAQAEVWHAHLDDTTTGQPPATPKERRLQAHRVLRHVVGTWLDRAADEIATERGPCHSCGAPHGPPRVTRPHAVGLEISLSYSHGRCLVGISAAGPIGVDIQAVTDPGRAEPIAARILSPDEAAMLERTSSALYARRVLGSWARKEACLKAVGIGIIIPMRDVDVGVPPAARKAPVIVNEQALSVADIPLDAAWVAAVALAADAPLAPHACGSPTGADPARVSTDGGHGPNRRSEDYVIVPTGCVVPSGMMAD